MNLEELEQQLLALRAKVKEALRAEKDVDRLSDWLNELIEEAHKYRSKSWYNSNKLKEGSTFFFKGQSREGREIAKRFLRWKASRRSAAEVEREADELLEAVKAVDDRSAEDLGKAAREKFDAAAGAADPAMSEVDLVVYDLAGEPVNIEVSGFRSSRLVSPFDSGASDFVDTGYFDLFDRLDEIAANSGDGFTLFLETGSALMRPLELPENWRDFDLIVPRAIEHETGEPTPVWDRAELIKNTLFPVHSPCLLVRNAWLREDDLSFKHLLSYQFWHLWLRAVDSQQLLQLDTPSLIAPGPRDPRLSHRNRRWLEEHDPELIPELRGDDEEWAILKHDLVARVVQANLERFQENVGYYAAVAQTGIRR